MVVRERAFGPNRVRREVRQLPRVVVPVNAADPTVAVLVRHGDLGFKTDKGKAHG